MEPAGDQSTGRGSVVRSSKLRYPLRSATRLKDGKPAAADASNPAPLKREKPSSDVSKSVSILDLSTKDKSAKPRRHSIPIKPAAVAARPSPATPRINTPMPLDARTRRSNAQGRNGTPASDVSASTSRHKFSTLSSASYWLTQIKLAEAASKHSIALGFFKLAVESGCKPLDRIYDELKAYIGRNNLAAELEELEEPVKDLLVICGIVEDFEQLKVFDPSSHPCKEGKSDKKINCSSSTMRAGNLKPRSLNSDTNSVKESNAKAIIQKGQHASRTRKAIPVNELKHNRAEKTRKQPKGNSSPNNPTTESVDVLSKVSHEDKENMDSQVLDVAVTIEEI